MAPQELILAHGQRTSWREYGRADGRSLFFCNGWPGCSEQALCLDEIGKQLGFRIIAPDRPGFGRSASQPGRGLLDWPPILAAIADHLEWKKFALMGVSGGGPYVLAAAWALGARVQTVCLCCSAVPTHSPEARKGLHPAYRTLLAMNDHVPWVLPVVLRGLALAGRTPLPWPVLRTIFKVALPPRDALAMGNRKKFSLFAPSFEGAMRAGGAALYQDGHPYSLPWPFPVEDISVPIRMWHGTSDANFQISEARKLAARLPQITFFERNEGHYSLPIHCAEEMLADLQSLIPLRVV